MNNNKVYRKIGRRYVELGIEFSGFPANGIWLVEDGKQNCLVQLSEISKLPHGAVIYRANYQEECLDYIMDKIANNPYSLLDIVKYSCDFFSIKAKENTNNL